jgi:hypothetical protein
MLSYFVNYGINQSIPGNPSRKWRIQFALQMLPGVLLLVGIVTQNESPRWLVEKDRVEDARRALSRAQGKPEDDPALLLELEEIIEDFRGRDRLTFMQQIKAACANKSDFYRCSMAVNPHVLATMDW